MRRGAGEGDLAAVGRPGRIVVERRIKGQADRLAGAVQRTKIEVAVAGGDPARGVNDLLAVGRKVGPHHFGLGRGDRRQRAKARGLRFAQTHQSPPGASGRDQARCGGQRSRPSSRRRGGRRNGGRGALGRMAGRGLGSPTGGYFGEQSAGRFFGLDGELLIEPLRQIVIVPERGRHPTLTGMQAHHRAVGRLLQRIDLDDAQGGLHRGVGGRGVQLLLQLPGHQLQLALAQSLAFDSRPGVEVRRVADGEVPQELAEQRGRRGRGGEGFQRFDVGLGQPVGQSDHVPLRLDQQSVGGLLKPPQH